MLLNGRANATRNRLGGAFTTIGAVTAGLALRVMPAQASPNDRVLAESLFEEGRALMAAGNYGEACPKLAESQRIDPGGGTLINLGICYEKAGKTASAWGAFTEALAVARKEKRPDRAAFAQERINTLKPLLSHLTVVVSAQVDVEGLAVTLDGQTLARPAWGMPIPLDPGEHQIEVSAPDRHSWTQLATLGPNADTQTLEVPVLEQLPTAAPVVPPASQGTPGVAATAATAQHPSRQPRQHAATRSPTLAYVNFGVGIVGLSIGSYFGVKAFSSWGDRNEHCASGVCDNEAVQLAKDTKRNATVANVAVGLGLVATGVGTYLLVSGPDDEQARATQSVRWGASVSSTGATTTLGGSW
ncbi:MAG: tetratricopeptide repeat protein [Polyangiaceae bacterium]|nr:tetratricopeptide repeat protein [Polyangiaceae bacterium]